MPDLSAGLRLYPRGFLGKPLPARLAPKPKPYELRIRTTPVIAIVPPQQNTADANPVVEQLYSQYIKRSAATMSFDYREKVLIAALDAFGTKNFLNWFESQLQSPAFGDTHARFLDDTLAFIVTGRRQMTLETWASFLKITDGGERPLAFTPSAEAFFGIYKGRRSSLSGDFTLVSVIQCWTAQPGGIEDLLGTLHLLFGNL